ncbi:MAG: hypothetical protein ACO3DS_09470, partial [Phycisphaerales bacterium]
MQQSLEGEVATIVRRWAPPRQVPELAAARTAAGMRLGANGVAFTLAVMSPTVTREADRLPTGELVDDGGASIELLERLAARKQVVFAGESVPADRLIPVAGQAVDPHIWFDPMLWQIGRAH